jgi:methyl-accepting chemotaxis protein
MLLGYEKIDINIVEDYKSCALGKWYYGIDCEKLKSNKAFKRLENPHIELHQVARDAAIAYEKGDITKAEGCLDDMDKYSLKVIEALDEIKEYLNNI